MDENLTPQWFKQNFLQRLDIMHEQSHAEIRDGKLPASQDKEKRSLEKDTTPLKATSLSDRITQKKAEIAKRKKQSNNFGASNDSINESRCLDKPRNRE